MRRTPEREESNTLSQATSPSTVFKKRNLESKEKKSVVQPKVSEEFKDENEKDIKRAAANGAQAREIRENLILSLTEESDKV
jgi:hypothetical protein